MSRFLSPFFDRKHYARSLKFTQVVLATVILIEFTITGGATIYLFKIDFRLFS